MEILRSTVSMFTGYAPPFLFVLTIVVFFHELGHFLMARRCGVGVKVFSIGFGPELIGWNDRKSTRWRIALIPLGGYVKFVGDESAASTPDREALSKMDAADYAVSFPAQSVGRRAAIVAAGPIANLILAVVIFSGLFVTAGRMDILPRVGAVTVGSAAEAAGIRAGDVVVAIEGHEIESFLDIMRLVSGRAGLPTAVGIDRDGKRLDVSVTPRQIEEKSRFGVQRRGLLGIQASNDPADRRLKTFGPIEGLTAGVAETWFVIERTGSYVAGIFSGRESADQLGGPLRVAQISGEVAGVGFLALINLAGLLSVSIGLLNLMPIPMLDGGHLAFYLAEAVRGRPLSERAQDIGFRIGLALVLALVIVSTWNDLTHLASL
ncbi:RIP metalloprotease [Siculibacillus lacustris]|uniref:RIP metalloprotease n=1 Tax=Siculibacillus lacustris TaxID=1549641 RepID=A0A4Q9VU12_9HYPH|nr:RIP metalloprotease [Siculibacillus lacustris]TBW38485.1 RIP metalloprotease [Siculibacillus lacustris]